MAFDELIKYIKDQLNRGVPREDIKVALRGQGWKEQDIADAFKAVNFEHNAQADTDYPADRFMKGRELMKRTIKIYKERIGTFLGIMSVPIFVAIIAFGIYNWALSLAGVSSLNYYMQKGSNWETFPFILATLGLLALMIISASIFQQIALMLAIKSRRERGILKFYKQAKDYFFKYFGVSMLVSIIVLAGFLLLVIPGIYFAIVYSLATVLVVFEGLGGMDALRKSKEYVKKDTWAYVKKWSYLIFLFGGGLIALQIIIGILFINYPDAGQSINDIISFILMPIPVIYTIELYRNLKVLNKPLTNEK